MSVPHVADLGPVLDTLAAWQTEGTPVQLHPGDLGWYWRHGAEATSAATRVWRREGEVVAVGLLDGPDLLRLALAPQVQGDEDLARGVVGDVVDPGRGVLPPGEVCVETPTGAVVHDLLGELGWELDEAWAVLRHDLGDQADEAGLRVEEVGPGQARAWCRVHRAAFGATGVSEDDLLQRWQRTAASVPFSRARCLLGRDGRGDPVAGVIVWSAGPGRYGVLEPMGVHPEHRGQGYGVAITRAAATTLRELGCSSAIVATPAASTGAVATYTAAGFRRLPDRWDRRRAG